MWGYQADGSTNGAGEVAADVQLLGLLFKVVAGRWRDDDDTSSIGAVS